MLVVQSLTNSFGTTIIAVSTVVMRVDGFAMMPNFTFGTATTTFTGQNIGAGRLDRVEKGTKEYEVDENYEMELLPKQQISIVVKTEKVKEIVELIKQELYTGHIGDGKIFVYDITNVIRVRTGDEGEDAL